MESGGGGDGDRCGFSYGKIDNNNFHDYNMQNHHSLFQATPPKTSIDRFLWSENNNQISQYPQTILPLSLQQNNGNNPSYYYYYQNNTILDSSPNLSSISFNGYNYHQNDGVYWPSQALLNFSRGQLLNLEKLKWNEQINIFDKFKEDSDLCKKNGGSGKNGKSEPLIKGQWTEEEDKRLIELVNKYGIKKWSFVSAEIYGRAGKQCRERWHNHLRSDIKKEPWSEAEERLLIETHKKLENRWSEIAKNIPGRTENSIKNHWNATKRKLDSRKRAKRRPRQNSNQSIILQDYIMSYYSKKTRKSTSLPTTTTPSMGTSEAIPTSIIPSSMTTKKYDMFVANISNSINNDQDNNTSSSMLCYDPDELNFFQSGLYSGNAPVDSSSCINKPEVGSTDEQQVIHGMMNRFSGQSSSMDSNTFITPPKDNHWNMQATRPDKYLGS